MRQPYNVDMENNSKNSAPDPLATATIPALTLEAIYTDKLFDAKHLRQPHWLKDGKRFSYLETAPESEVITVWMYDVATAKRTPLVSLEALQVDGEPLIIHGYQWSPDETRLLFARLPRSHDPDGDKQIFVYTLATKKLACIASTEQEYRNVKWSPDGRFLGYVLQDDLYMLDLDSGQVTRLTSSASATIYNGRFGWVYQEELYLVDGWEWSPDGQYIAYVQSDETLVPTVDLTRYDAMRLTPTVQRYPKAGDPNPQVRLGIIDIGKTGDKDDDNELEKDSNPIQPPTRWVELGQDSEFYIACMQWSPQGILLVQRIPRLQNRLDLLKVDPHTGAAAIILTETDEAWVDSPGKLTFVNKSFLWLSERSGYRHLYLFDAEKQDGNYVEGIPLHPLTEGEWEVEALLGVDVDAKNHSKSTIYFSAAHPQPHQRQIFSVSLKGGKITPLTTLPGIYHALFAPDAKRYLSTFSTRVTPPETSVCSVKKGHIATVHTNTLGAAGINAMAQWEFTSFETEEGVRLNAAILRPPDFDAVRTYPVLMWTYGGPGSQVVLDGYGSRIGLEQFFVQNGYILVMVDGRGSGKRGRDFKKITYLNLGQFEVEDQIAGAKWLGGLPYIDKERIGIWGWSYGGYMASLCILQGANVFKTAVAIAPVTHWKFYDTIYTERYMRRPADNPEGYERSSPLTHAAKLKGKFLLMHGLADDNVHFQNAAHLAELWQQQGKPFEMMVYPGKHHGLEGVGLHWARTLTDFIFENL